MASPVVTVYGSNPGVAANTANAVSYMLSHSSTFNGMMQSVGARYSVVQIFIGSGAGGPDAARLGNAYSGQDATNPNAWNVYIDTNNLFAVRNADGTQRTPYVEEFLAHELGHGTYGGSREGPNEHRSLVAKTDAVMDEIGAGGGSSSGSVAIDVAGRPLLYTPTALTDPRSLRFATSNDIVDLSGSVTPAASGLRKPFISIDADGDLTVVEEGADGALISTSYDDSQTQPWTTRTVVFDAAGRVDTDTTVADTGVKTVIDNDQASVETWNKVTSVYGTDGVIDTRNVAYDTGTRSDSVYDNAGRVDSTALYDAGARLDSYTVYDNAGRADSHAAYDDGNRLDSYTQYDDGGHRDVLSVFDDGNRLDARWYFDDADRADSYRAYDDNGLVDVAAIYDDAERIDTLWVFDDANRTDFYYIFDDNTAIDYVYQYDDASRLDVLFVYDNAGLVDTKWAYDDAGRLDAAVYFDDGSRKDYEYFYDDAGRVDAIKAYDDGGRVDAAYYYHNNGTLAVYDLFNDSNTVTEHYIDGNSTADVVYPTSVSADTPTTPYIPDDPDNILF